MNLWQYMDRAGERNALRESRIVPSDFRGWVAFGLFLQTCGLFALMASQTELTDNQGFMTLASAVIITGWVGGCIAFAYSAGKQQGEASALARQAMNLADNAQQQSAGAASTDTPQPVTVTNDAANPVPTTDEGKG